MIERPNPVDEPEEPEDPAPVKEPEPAPLTKKTKVTPLDEDENIKEGIEIKET